MKRNLILTAVMIFLSFCTSFAYTSISINDPRSGGFWANGNINSAKVTITPQGEYFYYDLELVLSVGTGVSYSVKDAYDSLEIACNFDLPAGAFIKGASLFIDTTWVEALLMPRKEAHAIYEGVVKRRRDPLIIYKNQGDNYLFKIFPISQSGTRTMKMTYAISASSLGGNKSAGLPMDLINASNIPVALKVLVKKSADFPDPSIVGQPNVTFTQSAANPDYVEATLPASKIAPELTSSSKIDSVRFMSSKGKDAITYKLSFNPAELFKLQDPKKLLFIIDNNPSVTYDTTYNYNYKYDSLYYTSSYTKTIAQIYPNNPLSNEILYTEIARMLASAHKGDFFNIIMKNNGVYTCFSNWIAVSPSSIQDAIDNLKANDDSYISDIKKLLVSATDLINEAGVIPILISNNNEYAIHDYSLANTYATEVTKALTYNKPVQVWDITRVNDNQSQITYYYYYYYNYFLYNLGNQLGKSKYYCGTIINNRTGFIDNFVITRTNESSKLLLFNVNTHSNDGVVYDRSISNPENLIPSNEFVELGKISKGTIFTADISFKYRGQQYMKKLEFPISNLENKILDDAWAVKIVDELNGIYSDESIGAADSISGQYHILTQNTALLSLEPGLVVEPCKTCPDWNNWSSIPVWRWNGPVIMTANNAFAIDKQAVTSNVVSNVTTVQPTVTTGTSSNGQTNIGIDYFEVGYQAGISEGENTCLKSTDNAYNVGYQDGYNKANATIVTSSIVEDKDLQVYPSPFVNELTITSASDKAVLVEIFDVTGKLVESVSFIKTITLNSANSKIASLPNGIYMVKTEINGVKKAVRIIKE